jgi:hypothetical protein
VPLLQSVQFTVAKDDAYEPLLQFWQKDVVETQELPGKH